MKVSLNMPPFPPLLTVMDVAVTFKKTTGMQKAQSTMDRWYLDEWKDEEGPDWFGEEIETLS